MVKRIAPLEVRKVLEGKLLKHGFVQRDAAKMAEVFMRNSLEGVYSHGINRFGRFLDYVGKGVVTPGAQPQLKSNSGALEQWDGRQGPGILNALFGVERAMALSDEFGIGCVAMANTNHWMRGGTYGRIAAEQGYIFIGWTNTIGNMPAWGARDRRLGNNPLVMAAPGEQPVVIDMAMSQYSYGKLEDMAAKGEMLGQFGGYDVDGNLSLNPSEILESERPLPAGYWKGAGLSLMLDLLVTILGDGLSTAEISEMQTESSVSQVFICIKPQNLSRKRSIADTVSVIIKDYKGSIPADESTNIVFPGERTESIVARNEKDGIPISDVIWEDILAR
jgi:3-dehydro-L-gulonate 2-dehydrogenase